MNTAPSLSQASSHFQPQPKSKAKSKSQSTALALARSIPGVMTTASLLQSPQPAVRARAVVELTIGKDPQTLVAEAVARVRHPGLNRLLASFMSAPIEY